MKERHFDGICIEAVKKRSHDHKSDALLAIHSDNTSIHAFPVITVQKTKRTFRG
jgi:hypothetical protein